MKDHRRPFSSSSNDLVSSTGVMIKEESVDIYFGTSRIQHCILAPCRTGWMQRSLSTILVEENCMHGKEEKGKKKEERTRGEGSTLYASRESARETKDERGS